MTQQQRAVVAGSAAAVLLLGLAALFLGRFRPALLLFATTSRAAVIAVGVVLASIAAGTFAIAVTRRIWHSDDQQPALADALLIGFVVLGTLLGVIAWIGVALELIVGIVALLLAAVGASMTWRRRSELRVPPVSLFLAIPLLFAIVEAITPVNSPDELVYKLATAHSYQMYGRMLELPLNSHSYLAMALQLGDLAALVLSGGIAAKLVHLALYIAGLAVTRRLASRFTERPDFVVEVVAWTPALMIVAGFAWSEWPLLALLLLSFERWTADDGAVSAAALGSAVACKYTALPWLLAMMIVILWRQRDRVLAVAAIVFAFGAFFYVRNAIWTGSPIAPMLLPDAPDLSHFRGQSGWFDLAHGVQIFSADLADESLGIFLPAMFLIGLAALFSKRRELRELAIIGAVQVPVLLAMAPVPRNLIGAVVPLAIAGAVLAGERIAVIARIAFLAQGVLVVFVLNSFDFVPYLAGTETESRYIARVREFAGPYAFIAAETPPRGRVLLLAENRTYYLDRESISGGNLDGPRIANWLARFPTPDALVAEWRRLGITHVLLHTRWYRVSSQPLQPIEREYVLQVTPQLDALLTTTLKSRAVLRYRDEAYLVFELR